MPLKERPQFDIKTALLNSLQQMGQADADDSPLWARLKGGLSGSLEAAADMFVPGNDDPIPAGVMPTPLISIYRDIAARQAATEAFRQSAGRVGLPNLELAANTFADKYPRVAAHIQIHPELAPGVVAAVGIPRWGVRKPLNMQVGAQGLEIFDDSPQGAMNAMFHEGTHTAQALGNSKAANLYESASQAVGYKNNPYEINARRAGEMAEGKEVGPYVPASKQLASIAQQPKGIMEHLYALFGKEHPATVARQRIDNELRRRKPATSLADLWGDPK
jgi:hypothetical protein